MGSTSPTDQATAATERAMLIRKIAGGVNALASRHRCATARQVHQSGISLVQYQVLWILQGHGPLPVSRLAEWLGIGVPNATGLLDRMEQRGLVERVRDAEDRRVVLVRETDAGRAVADEQDGWREETVAEVLAPLESEHLRAVADALQRHVDTADTSAASPPSLAMHAHGSAGITGHAPDAASPGDTTDAGVTHR